MRIRSSGRGLDRCIFLTRTSGPGSRIRGRDVFAFAAGQATVPGCRRVWLIAASGARRACRRSIYGSCPCSTFVAVCGVCGWRIDVVLAYRTIEALHPIRRFSKLACGAVFARVDRSDTRGLVFARIARNASSSGRVLFVRNDEARTARFANKNGGLGV